VESRPPTSSIPDAPGSYQFLDADGRVLYVGKAKSLRHRLSNYWQDPTALPFRTAQMVALADHVEWVVVGTEVEALILEHSLIQAHQPRFNVRLKDDKSYPWLAVTVGETWPRPMVFEAENARASGTSAPTVMWEHCGRPSICCCEASPSGPARTPSSVATSDWGVPVSSTTSNAALVHVSERWTTSVTRGWWRT
jgi:hypothetical protein